MIKHVIGRNEVLNEEKMRIILNRYFTLELPLFEKLKNYYLGKHAILNKQASDAGKACNKIVVNYCESIVNNYMGYLVGTPISYQGNNCNDIIEILKYNDVQAVDQEYLKQALIYGRSFHINYIDELGKQRCKILDTRECIPVYDDTLEGELLYVIRCWKEYTLELNEDKYYIEVYGPTDVKKYRSCAGFTSFDFLGSFEHHYKQCPITVFSLNNDEQGIFAQVMSLNDAYNSLVSGEVDSWDAFADCTLVLKGINADDEDLKNMKEHRCILLDSDSSAEYLTKNVTDTQVINMMENIDKKIHELSHSPDFTGEAFGAESGVSIRYKLIGMENVASGIEGQMRKALQRRVELLCEILKLTDDETTWRDVIIIFKRNLPNDINENADVVSKLKGIVSRKTLLSILPFVYDIDKEYAQVLKENEEDMRIYNEMNAEDINNDNSAEDRQEV